MIILLAFFIVLGFLTGSVFAVEVTINHAGGTLTGTLKSLTMDEYGNIILNVVEDLTGGGGGCENSRPSISVSNPPTSATVGSTVSASFNVSDPDGDTVKVTANVGSISGNTWTWTPQTTGTQIVTLTANDGKSCNNTSSYSWSINVTSSSGTTKPSGVVTLEYAIWTKGFKIPAYGTLYFEATLASACDTKAKQLRISVTGYTYGSNPDLFVKKSNGGTEPWPTVEEYKAWLKKYGYNSGQQTDGTYFSNFNPTYDGETVIVYSDVPGGQADTYYILLYNNSSTATSVDMYYYCY
jgi:hypothetical protein